MSNELMLPPYLFPATVELEKVDSVSQFQPLYGYAVSQRIDYGMTRWRAKLKFEKLASAERAALLAFVTAVGRSRGCYVPAYGESQRGSGAFPELLTNNTFVNGTTGWNPTSNVTLSVTERVMRMLINSDAATSPSMNQNAPVTLGVPYVARAVLKVSGNNISTITAGAYINTGIAGISVFSYIAGGLSTVAAVAVATGTLSGFYVLKPSLTDFGPGAFIEIPYTSFSRCALVDNGPNLLLQSQDFATTWTRNSCDLPTSNNTDVAPDGLTSAETLKDTVATAEHYVTQSVTVTSAAVDFSASCYFKASTGTWGYVRVFEGTGSTAFYSFINSSSGALGSSAVGANWSDVRATVTNVGNGWYRLTVTARKTNAATSLSMRVGVSNADNVFSYLGSGLQLAIWGASLAESSVPGRYVATTTTALPTGASQALTGGLHTKGWLVSTSGLLLAGDLLNVVLPNGLLLARLTAPLNSDAAGLAYAQFEPALPESPVDNAALIPNFPLLKGVITEVATVRTYPPGYQSDVELTVEGVFG